MKVLQQQRLNLYELFVRFDIQGNKLLDKVQFDKLLHEIGIEVSSEQLADLIYLISRDVQYLDYYKLERQLIKMGYDNSQFIENKISWTDRSLLKLQTKLTGIKLKDYLDDTDNISPTQLLAMLLQVGVHRQNSQRLV